jgi:hypothetical protein
MEKIYMILQYGSIEEIESCYQEQFIYYASNDLDDIENKIKNNFTDLYEAGAYPYIVLKTLDLNTVGAINEPLRIFKYKDGVYEEIAFMNLWISHNTPEGIQYLKENI